MHTLARQQVVGRLTSCAVHLITALKRIINDAFENGAA
jgi:hypothetical protein